MSSHRAWKYWHNYEMGGTILSKTMKQKDTGVTMNANMKVSEQCRIAASIRVTRLLQRFGEM